MDEHYSPRAALAEMETEGLNFGLTVSYTTLYSWIDKGYLGLTSKNLPEGRRRRKRKDKPARPHANYSHAFKTIDKRPKEIDDRQEFGHWEMDTVIGKAKGKQCCLLVLTERKTKMEIVRKMRGKTAAETVRVLNEIQQKFGGVFPNIFKTITCDNGCEFNDHVGIERDNRTKLYYCHPYSSWERGQNENANRLIRRFIPKGKSINQYSHQRVREVQDWMNHYPRQKLGWKRPIDLFNKELQAMGISVTI